MQPPELIPHLFRTEFSKITAVLCRTFGIQHIATAEDIASETFLAALETWSYKGVPANPVAWLYTVARNKAISFLKRNQVFEQKIAQGLVIQASTSTELSIDLSESNITDSQLRMLFVICDPVLSPESQVGLALRVLCGFGIDEIAHAFLTGKDTINKRLFRARERLRQEKVRIELPGPAALHKRLDNVLATIYLLFSEGYYSETNDEIIREDLCLEAIRLNYLLLQNPATSTSPAKALLALMCFQASRLVARKGLHGEIILYEDQDSSLWNTALIAKGSQYLHEASAGDHLSAYHLEAAIAYWHTVKEDTPEKWLAILQLHDRLLQMNYSPVAAMNRIYALSRVEGKNIALDMAKKLDLRTSPFWFALMGELYTGVDNREAMAYFGRAVELTVSEAGKSVLKKKMGSLSV